MNNGNILQARIGLYNALIYMPYGVLFPFLALWFAEYGWGWKEISIIIGMSFTLSVVFDPLIGIIADRTQAFRLILLILSALSLGFWLLLPIFDNHFMWVLICYSLFRLFWVALIPIADNLGFAITQDYNGNWGILRSFGSVAFIVTAQLTGIIIDGNENWAYLMLILVAIFMAILMAGTLLIPKYTITKQPEQVMRRVKLLFTPFMGLFMLAVFLFSKSHGQELFFGSARWHAIGFSASQISDLWTMRVGAEVIALVAFGYVLRTQKNIYTCKILAAIFAVALSLFFLLNLFKDNSFFTFIANISATLTYGSAMVAISILFLHVLRKQITTKDLILLSAFAAIIRWLILAQTANFFMVFIAESLHALTYGAFLIAGLMWIRSTLPNNLSTTAVGLFNGAAVLGYSIGAYMGGFLYEAYGAKAWYLEAFLAAISLLLFFAAFVIYDKNKEKYSF